MLVVGIALFALLGAGMAVLLAPNPAQPPPPTSPDQRALDEIPVAAPHSLASYSTAAFGPSSAPRPDVGPGCGTREAVLLLAAPDAQQGPHCTVVGTWTTNAGTTRNPGDLDVDHVVSLRNAWESGADRWSPQQRAAFATDLTTPELAPEPRDLVAEHQAAAGPWAPPAPQARCTYARNVIAVKAAGHLTVSPHEKTQLMQLLGHC